MQYSQENICGGASCKKTPTQVFSCEYCKILMNTFFTEHFRWLLSLFFIKGKFPSKREWPFSFFNKYNLISYDANLLKLVVVLHIYIIWVTFQQFSRRDLKPMAFLVNYKKDFVRHGIFQYSISIAHLACKYFMHVFMCCDSTIIHKFRLFFIHAYSISYIPNMWIL